MYLFTYGLFNDTVSITYYSQSNAWIEIEWATGEGEEGSFHRPVWCIMLALSRGGFVKPRETCYESRFRHRFEPGTPRVQSRNATQWVSPYGHNIGHPALYVDWLRPSSPGALGTSHVTARQCIQASFCGDDLTVTNKHCVLNIGFQHGRDFNLTGPTTLQFFRGEGGCMWICYTSRRAFYVKHNGNVRPSI